MQWLVDSFITFKKWLKLIVAGEEIAALERYREACQHMQMWQAGENKCSHTAKWIERHGESIHSEMGRALHLEIGRRYSEVLNSTLMD